MQVVAHVTHPSREPSYGTAMLVVLGIGTVLANLAGGPVGNFLTLLLGCASLGALTAAWMSMIAAFVAPADGAPG